MRISWDELIGRTYAQHLLLIGDGQAILQLFTPRSSTQRPLYFEFRLKGRYVICETSCLEYEECPFAHRERGDLYAKILKEIDAPANAHIGADGTIILSCILPLADFALARIIFRRFFEIFHRFYLKVIEPCRKSPPSLKVIYPGRFQPYHVGHHNVLKRLIKGDPSIFAKRADRDLLRYRIDRIVIAIADHGDLDKKRDPLTVGERRTLIEHALHADKEIRDEVVRKSIKIEIDRVQWNADYSAKLLELVKCLHLNGTPAFVSENIQTFSALKPTDFICMQLVDRRYQRSFSGRRRSISGSAIRQLIVRKKFKKLKELIPPGAYEEMLKRGMFKEISELAR